MRSKRYDLGASSAKSLAKICVLSITLLLIAAGCSSTTAFVLRHAEKTPGGNDPPLSPEGQLRAQELIQVAGQAGVTVIYATQFVRTQQTAQPLANHLGIDINIFNVTANAQQYAEDLVNHILTEHSGEVVLIVSHSNTVHLIVEALGANSINPLDGNEYDKLFIVSVPRWGGSVKSVNVEYGD